MAYDAHDLETFLKGYIRNIPDFPEPGIIFRDITTLLQSADALKMVVDAITAPYEGIQIDTVAGIEARGFILGGVVAHQLGAGFVPIRKPGKLPAATYSQDYTLEYGVDTLEVHQDALPEGTRVLLIDDLIATGGTAIAALELIRQTGAEVVASAFVIDLPDLGGREKLEQEDCLVTTLCTFEGL